MKEYHKINTIYKRSEDKKHKIIIGSYSEPEFEYLKDNKWEWTEKIDGTNIRVMYDEEKVTFGGKTDNASIPAHLYTRLTELFTAEKLKEVFGGTSVCLYGEGFGYKIQGEVGFKYLKDQTDFYLFDIKIGEYWLERNNVMELAKKLNVREPIIVNYGSLDSAEELVRKGFKSAVGSGDAEGLVLRPTCELRKRNGDRIITKIKTRDFL